VQLPNHLQELLWYRSENTKTQMGKSPTTSLTSVQVWKGQIDAYTTIAKGIKVHNVTGEIYVFGLRMKKEILQPGTYPTMNSKELTIAKNVLRKELKSSKFTQFKISEISEIKIAGEEISFS